MTDYRSGLTAAQAKQARERFGPNQLSVEKQETWLRKLLGVLKEPMFLLLLIAATFYFVLGEWRDGFVMLGFVVGIIGIETFQEFRTDKTLQALKDLSAPTVTVVRDGAAQTIHSIDLVVGDIMIIEEGIKIPADGFVVRANDLSVDESTLTGESVPVTKVVRTDEPLYAQGSDWWRLDQVYAGTLVQQGSGTIEVTHIGLGTEYGKIGVEILEVPDRPTPLEKQTARLVKICAIIALAMSVLVAVITYLGASSEVGVQRAIDSVLSGITIAMSLLPEEFPVILAVFLSMGAFRLAKRYSLVRRLSSVETLGAVSVLCSDKTGTITKNRMELTATWTFGEVTSEHMLHTMGLACETEAYDPMEKAMLEYCEAHGIGTAHLFEGTLLHEYAFSNESKMMGHVWDHEGEFIVAAKGSPEHVLASCDLSVQQRAVVDTNLNEMAQNGLRVIAIATQTLPSKDAISSDLGGCRLALEGLVGLADPPREGVAKHIATCQKAGIRVIMITGDNGITASAIARQVGLANPDVVVTGEELASMSERELCKAVQQAAIFSRVVPEHKMRIVQALQANGEVVAMTGDGVNDAPALKNADIGVAMGQRGSEVAREAADLILLDDNFGTIVATIENGRRIYDNIKKAVGYVFAVHIPIAFAAFFAPLLSIKPNSLMIMPLHVLLLELVIDPVCSVVLECQPSESGIMRRPPRNPRESILTRSLLAKAVVQGLVIALVSFVSYYFLLEQTSCGAQVARTVGLGIMLIANLMLVFVNSSNYDLAFKSFLLLLRQRTVWLAVVGLIAMLAVVIYTPLNGFFDLAALNLPLLAYMVGAGILSVAWYEAVKAILHIKRR